MRSTLEDCFREWCRDELIDCLENGIKDISDLLFDSFVEDPYSFNDYVDVMFVSSASPLTKEKLILRTRSSTVWTAGTTIRRNMNQYLPYHMYNATSRI